MLDAGTDAEVAPAEDRPGSGGDGSPDPAGQVADGDQVVDAGQDADVQAAVALDLEALGDIEREFADVDRALRRLDDGTYWMCESCGEAIDEALLTAAPLGRICTRCAPVTQRGPGPDPAAG